MDIQTLTSFFMWCTIINTGFMVVWVLFITIAPNLVYRVQTIFFTISRENFDLILYAFLGAFKIFLLIFNLVPWLALLIIG